MKRKPTPSPWIVETETAPRGIYTVRPANGSPVCQTGNKANAYLIASCHDMLHALRECKRMLEWTKYRSADEEPIYEAVIAALKKAEGKAK